MISTKYHRVIQEVVKEKKEDPRVISILLFGSLAKGTNHKGSDIDLEIIYAGGKWKESNKYVKGIKVDFEVWPRDKLLKRVRKYPFLSYPYINERILYDPKGFAKRIKKEIKSYFKKHPEVSKIWKEWEVDYQKKKKSGEKVKNINVFYNQLKSKFKKI